MKSVYTYLTEKSLMGKPIKERHSDVTIVEKCDDYDVVEKLLNDGVDPDTQDAKGRTALMMTTEKEVVKLLISSGANLNIQDKDGYTALHHCAYNSDSEIAEILVKVGAKTDIKNKNYDLPTDLAIYEKDLELFNTINPNAPLGKYFEYHISGVDKVREDSHGNMDLYIDISYLKSAYVSCRDCLSFEGLEKFIDGEDDVYDISYNGMLDDAIHSLNSKNTATLESKAKELGWDEEDSISEFVEENMEDLASDLLNALESAYIDEYYMEVSKAVEDMFKSADLLRQDSIVIYNISREKALEIIGRGDDDFENFIELKAPYIRDTGYSESNFNDILGDISVYF